MKIFDSLVHPTLSGKANKHGISTSFDEIDGALKKLSIEKILAIGMPEPDYTHLKFFNECSKYSRFVPVAALTCSSEPEIEIKEIKEIGYKAIKIHPRSLKGKLDKDQLLKTLLSSEAHGLKVLLCTYCYSDIRDQYHLSLLDMLDVISRTPPSLKIMLVHGGVFDLLKVLEISKYTENVLVDLSFTLMKYSGTSLDLDIIYALNNFDRKICVGSDFPDFTLENFERRIISLSNNLPLEKKENILFKNLEKFMDL